MKIQTKYPDYYDWVASMYGGGDPKLVWMRKKLPLLEGTKPGWAAFNPEDANVLELPADYWHLDLRRPPNDSPNFARSDTSGYDYKTLSVCGRIYHVAHSWTVGPPEGFLRERKTTWGPWFIVGELDRRRSTGFGRLYESGIRLEPLVRISKLIACPVFEFHATHNGQLEVIRKQVILSDYGFPALIGPEQMYQEVSLFYGEIMHQEPQPTPVSDVQKAEAHGFDRQQSFRHRKE